MYMDVDVDEGEDVEVAKISRERMRQRNLVISPVKKFLVGDIIIANIGADQT